MFKETKPPEKEELYFPYLQELRGIFDRCYVAESYVYAKDGRQIAPSDGITNPHLEIMAQGNFSEKLQNNFEYYLFKALSAEKFKPDIMGFVQKKPSSKKEFITVEVKLGAISIKDVLQAKAYADIFNAKFSFVISPEGIPPEKLKIILQYNNALRGNVIPASCLPESSPFRINPLLAKFVPEPFPMFCK